MQPEQIVYGVIQGESCILVHEAFKRSRQVVFLENFLGKILVKDSPRDFPVFIASVLEYLCREVPDRYRPRTSLARDRDRGQLTSRVGLGEHVLRLHIAPEAIE
jgi:hypothetical protein